MAENKTKDLTPKSYFLVPAEQELIFPTVDLPMGQRIGGLSMFGDSFKRGSGDQIFGASNDGIWLGDANFEDAPFSVDMDGSVNIQNGDNSSLFNADVLVFYESGVPSIIIGDPTAIP